MRGMTPTIAAEIAYFCASQCNTFTRFSEAMHQIIQDDLLLDQIYSEDFSMTMYSALVRQCLILKPEKESHRKSVGSDKLSRFKSSNQEVLSTKDLNCVTIKLLNLCQKYRTLYVTEMKHSVTSYQGKYDRLVMTNNLCEDLKNDLPSIGTVSSRVLLVLIGIFHLVPLDLVVSMPLHTGKGTGEFVRNFLGWNASGNDLQKLTAELWHSMSRLFNNELTSEIIEQLCCRENRATKDRQSLKRDVHMTIPRYISGQISEDGTKYVGGHLSNVRMMQSFYIITGRNEGKWYLECFDGTSKTILFSENSKKGGGCMWDWNRNCLVFVKN